MPQEAWQLTGSGPDSYERYQVPSVFAPLARLFLKRVPLAPGQRVLDVACGTGIVARQVAPVLGSTGSIVGIELNAAMLDVARQHAPGDGAPVEWGRAMPALCPVGTPNLISCCASKGCSFSRTGRLHCGKCTGC